MIVVYLENFCSTLYTLYQLLKRLNSLLTEYYRYYYSYIKTTTPVINIE